LSQRVSFIVALACAALPALAGGAEAQPEIQPDAARVAFQWGVSIPMRDGAHLNATLYRPKEAVDPAPCVFTLTPYISASYHDRGVYFAAHGLPFLTVDVRGRGNSEGQFRPMIQEAHDGYDVVEWLAQQPYCNGKVAMWGGSYAGYDQWATAKERPPHLATIVPVASVYPGIDFPMRNNISYPYVMQWLTFTSGHASQESIFGDQDFWAGIYRAGFESGAAFGTLDARVGNPSAIFREWVSHPEVDSYWDSYTPTAAQYTALHIPILTITGSNDDDQPGALTYYRQFMEHASADDRARHYLIIGPWDHAGTRTPRQQFAGLQFGPASLVDLPALHREWYAWTMQNGPKPAFLQRQVAYYVMGAEKWRYADTLQAVTARSQPYFLDSTHNAHDVLSSGALVPQVTAGGRPDHYEYDPRDTHNAALESTIDPDNRTEQRMTYAARGGHLVYHSAPFEQATEISGFFKLAAWIAIDQPDTDLLASIYEIRVDGSSILLSTDQIRARYRSSLRQATPVRSTQPLRYDFERFTFVSREIKKGSRLRLVIGPINSIFSQKNYNSGGVVAQETARDARRVSVTLFHDRSHPSALYVPLGQPEPRS
jgi:putative CocE/NonD family hydrolase